MKKVLLLGDSIRLGYENYVKESLQGVAEVFSPKDNGAFAQYTLRWIYEWKERENFPDDVDLVHWNVGLWDVLRILGDDTFTSPAHYADNLKRLEKRLRLLFPKAKQIFATSTAIIEKGWPPPYQRYNKDIEQFNKIAVETLAPLNVSINDLYALTKNVDESFRSDVSHFSTPQGVKLLGGRVVEVVCKALDIPLTEIQTVQATVSEIDEKILGR